MSRLASTWGLAYVWEVPKDAKKERMIVFDALSESDSRLQEGNPVQIGIRAAKTRFWSEHYGAQEFSEDELKLQLYGDGQEVSNSVKFSSYELGNILMKKLTTDDLAHREAVLRAAHDNRGGCFGLYYHGNSSSSLPVIGQEMHFKVAARKDGGLQCSPSTRYMLTKMKVQVTQNTWQAEVEGTHIDEARQPKCLCLLPRPVIVNNRAPGTADMLTAGENGPMPKMRLFVAQVVDTAPFSYEEGEKRVTENTCKVREIAPLKYMGAGQKSIAFANEIVVELGSPFADKNSGLLARPRVGNVLVCLDRGDFSLPVAISSLYRDQNASPFVELKTMERHTLKELKDVADYSAVTLRNRVQLPPRKYQKDTKETQKDTKETQKDTKETQKDTGETPAKDEDLTNSKPADVTRPLSVDELAEAKYPFHQIQLVTRDNGVRPMQQNKDITNTYIYSDVIETAAGVISEANMSAAYIMEAAAETVQLNLNAPITRPHFEGVNVYSAKDVLVQSADHQIVNAGGEIVLTSAQAITFRVGRSSIKITESGIEMTSACGKVLNSGAYAAYNPIGKQQTEHLMGVKTGGLLGGWIRIDGSGVNIKGPYISNKATNMFAAETFLGSTFRVTDLSATLMAPKTTVVGGAAVHDTITSGAINLALSGVDAFSATGTSCIYRDALQNGYRVYGLSSADFAGNIGSGVVKITQTLGGIVSNLSSVKNLVSVTGSMVKMEPDTLTISSSDFLHYHATSDELNTPLGGFVAMGERCVFVSTLKKLSGESQNTLGSKIGTGVFSVLAPAITGGVGTYVSLVADKGGLKKGKDVADTFTVNGEKPELTCVDSKESKWMLLGGGIGGTVVVGGLIVGLVYGIGKTLKGFFNVLGEKLFNLLCFGKMKKALGKVEEETYQIVTRTFKRDAMMLDMTTRVVRSELTRAEEKRRAAQSTDDALVTDDRSIDANNQNVNENNQALRSNDTTLTGTQTGASSSDLNVIDSNTAQLHSDS